MLLLKKNAYKQSISSHVSQIKEIFKLPAVSGKVLHLDTINKFKQLLNYLWR